MWIFKNKEHVCSWRDTSDVIGGLKRQVCKCGSKRDVKIIYTDDPKYNRKVNVCGVTVTVNKNPNNN